MHSQNPTLSLSPSFINDVADVTKRISAVELSINDDFTFSVSSPKNPDDIAHTFPLFNRELLSDLNPDPIELRSGSTSSTSSSSSVEADEESYCVCDADRAKKKSASTGNGSGFESESKLKWWKMLRRRRSVSDGRDKFEYLNAVSGLKSDSGKNGKKKDGKEMNLVTAHKLFYGKETKSGKKTFLPYRQDLVGLW